MDFRCKVALISGGSSGIGAETAKYFSKLGANVAITDRQIENLNKVADEYERKPFTIAGDLTIEEDVKNIVTGVIQHFGKLDILVNCAGVYDRGSIETEGIMAIYDKVFNVNVRSLMLLTFYAVPHLKKTKGNIISISSRAGLRSFPNSVAYCMSKSAVDQFTRCTALDLAQYQIRVNAVNPGVTETKLWVSGGLKEEEQNALYDKVKGAYPLGRTGQPNDVAKAIAFFASENASYITGVTCSVDGGAQLLCP